MYWVDGGDKKTCMPERERKEREIERVGDEKERRE